MNNMFSTYDTYNSNYIQDIKKQVNTISEQNYIKSQTTNSNIIPPLYNSINSPNNYQDKNNLNLNYIENMDNIINNKKNISKQKNNPKNNPSQYDNNNFLSQFSPLKFDNKSGPVSKNSASNANTVARFELERTMAVQNNYSDFNSNNMDYNAINDPSKFASNNRPFFKTNGQNGMDGQGEEHRNEVNQRKMELFSGSSNNLGYRPHIERTPLFNPVIGNTNIYGSPVMTDFYEKRYEPSRERRNELPFQQVKVTPGLGLGANENNKQGYQEMYRTMPKTVDELRTANKPKISYTAPVVRGIMGHKGKVIAKSFKHRPNTFREYGLEWLIPGVSDVKAQKIEGEIDPNNLATINRGMSNNDYIGPAKSNIEKNTPEALKPKLHESSKENYLQAEPRNLAIVDGQKARGFDNTYDNKLTDRVMHNNYLGPAGNHNQDKNTAYNYNDAPNLTNVEMFINTDRVGNMSGNVDKIKAYNLQDMPDNTMRDIHNKFERAGQVGNGQFTNPTLYNLGDVQDNTMRTIHNKLERAGQIGNGQFNNPKLYNFEDVQDNTMRTIHNKLDRAGQMGNGQYNKNYAFDFVNNIQDNTMRNIHDKLDRAGQMGNGQFNKNYAFDFVNNIPNNTLREMQIKQNYIAPSKTQVDQTRSRLDANNMDMNVIKEVISKGRAPTSSNYNKGPTFKFTHFEERVPLQVNRELYPKANQEAFYRHDPNITKTPLNLMGNPYQFDSFVDENLKTNPYINNIIHKASS